MVAIGVTRDEVLHLEENDLQRVARAEERALRWLAVAQHDGWLLRSTGGASRRPNSVNCINPGTVDLQHKVVTVQALYRRRGRRVIFRLTPLADTGLDALLDQRGYTIEEPTFVQIADDTWIAAASSLRGLAVFAAQQPGGGCRKMWAVIHMNDRPVAVGVAGIERGWAELHGIYFATDVRRLGVARKLSEALLGLSYARGARRAWLQVAQDNAAASPLYRSIGCQRLMATTTGFVRVSPNPPEDYAFCASLQLSMHIAKLLVT